jgi:hypothetical protein
MLCRRTHTRDACAQFYYAAIYPGFLHTLAPILQVTSFGVYCDVSNYLTRLRGGWDRRDWTLHS